MSDQPSHTSPHSAYSNYWVKHSLLVPVDQRGMWKCVYCECPHIEMPDGEGTHYLVAAKAEPCPDSFELPCPKCDQVYACLPGCDYIGPLEDMIEKIIITESSD